MPASSRKLMVLHQCDEVVVVVDGVVDAALLPHEVGQDVVEPSVVTVTGADETLQVAAVAEAAPGGGECRQVPVLHPE